MGKGMGSMVGAREVQNRVGTPYCIACPHVCFTSLYLHSGITHIPITAWGRCLAALLTCITFVHLCQSDPMLQGVDA
jgi:hypothetical protein